MSVAAYPGLDKGEVGPGGERLLDSVTATGPAPYMIADAVAAVLRNAPMAAVVKGSFRRDVPAYPEVALREAIANAFMHRNYSESAPGTPVQLDIYPNRVVIVNPGGLFGTMTIGMLGRDHGSSSHNQFLASILESTPADGGGYVVENRGNGYRAIERTLASAGMPEPEPRN